LARANYSRLAPVPLTAIDCGLLGALSVIFSVAVKLPMADGVESHLNGAGAVGPIETPPQFAGVAEVGWGWLRCCRSHSR